MKKTLLSFLLGITAIGSAQITTSSSYTPEQLVNDILLANSGITATNITSSSAINFTDVHSLGYFNRNGSTFNFDSGLVLASGNIADLPGPIPSTVTNLLNWQGDTDINIPNGLSTFDATSIAFDFVAPTEFLSFNYLYATGEYSSITEFCNPIDQFAFILTDSEGNKVNLAVLPGTTTPVCNTSVNNGVDGSTLCSGNLMINYGSYSTNPAPYSPINIMGSTIPLTAQAQVIAGETYNLKIVIGDLSDTNITSAVFIEQGSFQTTSLAVPHTPDAFAAFTVFPNPTSEILNINNSSEIETVSLYNMLGQELKRIIPNIENITIDISNLAQGTYILKVMSAGKEKTTQIIKK